MKANMGCLALLAFLAATAGPLYLFLHADVGPPVDRWAAGVGAFVSLIAFGMLQESLKLGPKWRAAGAAAYGGQALEDGKEGVASGTIHPRAGQELLEAPFTGRRCVAYSCQVVIPGTGSSRMGDRDTVEYGGFAYVPCEIRTAAGPVPVDGLPSLTMRGDGHDECTKPEERRRARTYVDSTTFEPLSVFDWGRVLRLGRELREWTGPFRKDFHNVDPIVAGGFESRSLHETVLLPGEAVTVVGVYSSARGLGPKADDWDFFELKRGDAATFARNLRSRAVWRLVGALVIVGVMYGIIWLAARQVQRDRFGSSPLRVQDGFVGAVSPFERGCRT